MSNEEKYFDVRVVGRYIKKGTISDGDVDTFKSALPNDEDNFELVMIEEDDIGIGDELSEEELKAMPTITEDNIDNFDFLEDESSDDLDIPSTDDDIIE